MRELWYILVGIVVIFGVLALLSTIIMLLIPALIIVLIGDWIQGRK